MLQEDRLLLRMLKEIKLSDGITIEHIEKMAIPETRRRAPSQRPPVTSEVVDSWMRFEQGNTLDERDLYRLRSIILPEFRPVFYIKHDSYQIPSSSLWQDLNNRRAAIEPLIRGIGRLDLTDRSNQAYPLGTAFLCGEHRIITNRHVVSEYFTHGLGSGTQLAFRPGITAAMDLKQEVDSTASIIVPVTEPVLVMEEWDVAILGVGTVPGNVMPLPLAASAPVNTENRKAVVIGYPAYSELENLSHLYDIFGEVFDKKRLQPGMLKGVGPILSSGREVQALVHDCTTVGGNSGSAVIDVDTGKVVGIHFTGQPLVANYAVPTWVLAGDKSVRNSGVVFAD